MSSALTLLRALAVIALSILAVAPKAFGQPTCGITMKEIDALSLDELVRVQAISRDGLRLRDARVRASLFLRDAEAITLSDIELRGLRVTGNVTGSVLIERATIQGECKLIGLRIGGDLVFRDCVFGCGFLIDSANVNGDLIVESCVSENHRSEVQNVHAESIIFEKFRNMRWEPTDGVLDKLDYRALEIQNVDATQDLILIDVVTSVMSVGGSVGRDLLLSGNAAGRVRLEHLAVHDRSTIWPGAPLRQLEVVWCDLGDAVRLRLPTSTFPAPQVVFGGSISGFRELPAASQLIPVLRVERKEDDYLATLTALMRGYEAIGNTTDMRHVEGVIAGLQVRRSRGIEVVEQWLRWLVSGPSRTPRLVFIWIAIGAGGFLVLWLGQLFGLFRIHVSPELREALQPRTLGSIGLATKVALDGMMPVPVEHGLVLAGVPFFVHASMRLLVWLLLLLFVQSLA